MRFENLDSSGPICFDSERARFWCHSTNLSPALTRTTYNRRLDNPDPIGPLSMFQAILEFWTPPMGGEGPDWVVGVAPVVAPAHPARRLVAASLPPPLGGPYPPNHTGALRLE